MSTTQNDLRQIARMKTQLSSYKQGLLSLGDLTGDLVFLRDALDDCSKEWDIEFTAKLTDLESVESYLIEKSANELDDLMQPIVEKAIAKIHDLIDILKS